MRIFYSGKVGVDGVECRVTVFVAEDDSAAPLVVVSERAGSISNVAEYLAAEVQSSHEPLLHAVGEHHESCGDDESEALTVGTPYIYVEHYPARVEGDRTRHEVPLCEAWSLVTFDGYEPREIRRGDTTRLRLGDASWKYVPGSWMSTLLPEASIPL